ncbi:MULTISPECIES: hypothetical protein [Nitrosomonas]|uniref:hypothetical protein n=1 Tax=Nitrosomonas TaxID=914 RepID=UPI001370071D|nr:MULTISPECIES: hypothetical protein [Nitrosomonas]
MYRPLTDKCGGKLAKQDKHAIPDNLHPLTGTGIDDSTLTGRLITRIPAKDGSTSAK